jgi:hypothetical protein
VAPTRETKSIDRRLILKGLAIGAAAAVLPGVARTSAWGVASDRDLEALPAVWEQISSLARWAPTPHNTQPFRLLPRDDRTADIVILTERMLPREDHGNRYGRGRTMAIAMSPAHSGSSRPRFAVPVSILVTLLTSAP